MKPNFIIIGAMKCGTTSMSYYLSQTKDIYIPPQKDLYFFSDNKLYNKGWDWYQSFFKTSKKIIGEGTDDYSKFWVNKETVKRIKFHLPDVKLIYIVRHPLRQIESAWLHRIAASHEKYSFNEAILKSNFKYIETANYWTQLSIYLKYFDEKQILVLFNEDLKNDPKAEVKKVLRFLGCNEDISMINFEHKNTAQSKRYDKKIATYFRKIKIIEKFVQSLPDNIKQPLKLTVTNSLKERPKWDKDVKYYVRMLLEENSNKFLQKYEKDKKFWLWD